MIKVEIFSKKIIKYMKHAVNIYILEKYNKLKGLYKKIMSQIACRELLNENFKIVVLAFRI
jgi:hypothetical protein